MARINVGRVAGSRIHCGLSSTPQQIAAELQQAFDGDLYLNTKTAELFVFKKENDAQGVWSLECTLKGEKGDPIFFEELTAEQKESLKGEKGEPGEKGEKGDKGEDGAQGPVGKYYNYRGLWSPDEIYANNTVFQDVVMYEGRLYLTRIQTTMGSTPPPEKPYAFALFSEKGEKGDKGDKGDNGDSYYLADGVTFFVRDGILYAHNPVNMQNMYSIKNGVLMKKIIKAV